MDNSELLTHSKKWDRTGVFVSALCILHCLAFPFIILFLPALDAIFGNKIFEALLLTVAITVGSVSFFTSYKKHRKIQPLLLGLIGVGFLSFSLFFDLSTSHDHPHELSAQFFRHLNPFMVLGGLTLVCGHIWNIHACHCFCDKGCSHEEHHSH